MTCTGSLTLYISCILLHLSAVYKRGELRPATQVVKEAARQPRVDRDRSQPYSTLHITMTSLTMLTLAMTGLLLGMTPSHVEGHGYMLIPPGRSSAWRFNGTDYFHVNYDDNANYCGGFGVQFHQNDGKCGVCGDNYAQDVPRDNERGGYYSTGNIVAQYASGEVIDVAVVLTANHFGSFFFDICPTNNAKKHETEECFQPLMNADNGKDHFELPNWDADTFRVRLQIPERMTCFNCVLRWKYVTGNSWGCEEDVHGKERCCTGCGSIQEHFFSCADVMITRSGAERIPPWKKIDKSSATTTKRTTTTTTTTTTRPPPKTTTRRPRRTTTRRPRRTTTTVATTTTTENRFCSEICDDLCKPNLQMFCFDHLCGECQSYRVLKRFYNKG
ncbi:uncharacterized protein LOC124264286 [Haliotis rubra]|uniref:uncharacterized protein LOC124264286 n=1 Tax=Haliotis rubra TaxID=36100 RepID=UPI001EE5D2CD|nr:uncharacterized protein LOC124264286 [Haliotis rubra]